MLLSCAPLGSIIPPVSPVSILHRWNRKRKVPEVAHRGSLQLGGPEDRGYNLVRGQRVHGDGDVRRAVEGRPRW